MGKAMCRKRARRVALSSRRRHGAARGTHWGNGNDWRLGWRFTARVRRTLIGRSVVIKRGASRPFLIARGLEGDVSDPCEVPLSARVRIVLHGQPPLAVQWQQCRRCCERRASFEVWRNYLPLASCMQSILDCGFSALGYRSSHRRGLAGSRGLVHPQSTSQLSA